MSLRDATEADLPAIRRLCGLLLPWGDYADMVASWLKESQFSGWAEVVDIGARGGVVAVCIAQTAAVGADLDLCMEIRMLAVDPSMQGRGFGSMLLSSLQDRVQEDPVLDGIFASCGDDNTACLATTAKAGFAQDRGPFAARYPQGQALVLLRWMPAPR